MKPEVKNCFCTLFLICFSLFLPSLSNADPLDNWHVRSYSIYRPLRAVTYGNGMFVAVGEGSTILTSNDGASWTRRTSESPSNLRAVTYGNGIFVAAGDSGRILTSPDGLTWTERSSSASIIQALTYGNGVFVAVGSVLKDPRSVPANVTLILTSTDGLTWTERPSGIVNGLYGVTYGNGLFVAVGDGGTILTSPDGVTWTRRAPGISASLLFGITYGNGIFITVGDDAAIITSPDAIVWTSRSPWHGFTLNGVTSGNGSFVIVGGDLFMGMLHTVVLLTSSDGITWVARPTGLDFPLYGIAHGNNTFVAVGELGAILQSDTTRSADCTAALSPTLRLHVPVINFNGTLLAADLQYEQGSSSDILFRTTNAGAVTNPNDYSACQASILSMEAATGAYKLNIPAILFEGILFWGDFTHVPTTDGQIWFKLTQAGQN